MKSISAAFIAASIAVGPTAWADTFNRTKTLEVQYISLGSTYYAHVLQEHETRETLVRQIRQSPDAALQAEFGSYLEPTLYNTIVFNLYPDGSVSAEILDPTDHTQFLQVSGTYDRQGRNLVIALDDDGLQIWTVFVGKASKDSKKCYQGTSEAPQADFPGSFWVTYWQGCR